MFPEIVFFDGSILSFFNLFAGIGMVFFFLFIRKISAKMQFSASKEFKINTILSLSLVFGILGARLFDAWVRQLPILQAGYTFLGGLIAAMGSAFILSLFFRLNFLFLLNMIAPAIALGHGLGRIGCFFAGCCHGHPTHSFLGVIFPEKSPAHLYFGSVPVHPTQLYEAIGLFLIFFTTKRISFENRFSAYLVFYGVIRFVIEFFRGDSRGELPLIGFLSPSQILSLLMLLTGIVLFLILNRKK